MHLVSIVDVLQCRIPFNTVITIQGWVRTRRDSKSGISFVSIYDGSCFSSLQAIIYNTLPNYKTEVLHLTAGCSIIIIGKLIKNLSKYHIYEIQTQYIKVLGWINNPDTYPITAKRHSIEYLREVAHLRPRTNLIGAVARIRHTLAQAIHRFMNNKGFFWVATPLITASDTEGAGKMFRVSTLDLENIKNMQSIKKIYKKDFFKKNTFLTVSGQLNIESYACALSKVYTFGPTFRAENSNTTRHLSEFWMLEPELAFASLEDISILSEKLIKYILKVVLNERANDINFFCEKIDKKLIKRLNNCINNKFIQIEYTEAIKILKNSKKNFKNNVSWGIDLSSEHERYLTEKYFKSIIIIKNYPKKIKAFYMRINNDNKTVAAMDMLAPDIGEIIGGSQREERLDKLDIRIKEMNLNKNDYWWYRDLRKYGTVPHSGFGLGFERLILYVTGLKNIRDVIAFPRFPGNVKF